MSIQETRFRSGAIGQPSVAAATFAYVHSLTNN